MHIAFLGLGRMGRVLAGHLLEDGHELTVWNRTAGKSDALVARGASAAPTPAEATAHAQCVVTAFFGADAVDQVVLGADLPFAPGALWQDVTTVGPSDARRFAAWAAGRGLRFASTPVIGTIAPARARALGVAVGSADESARGDARAVARSWSSNGWVREYDSAPGAEVAKLIANVGIATASEGIREALRIGHGGGFTTEQVVEALQGTMLEKQVNGKKDVLESKNFAATAFSANLLAKDIRLMIATAQAALPSATAFLDALEAVQHDGHGEDDFTAALARDV